MGIQYSMFPQHMVVSSCVRADTAVSFLDCMHASMWIAALSTSSERAYCSVNLTAHVPGDRRTTVRSQHTRTLIKTDGANGVKDYQKGLERQLHWSFQEQSRLAHIQKTWVSLTNFYHYIIT